MKLLESDPSLPVTLFGSTKRMQVVRETLDSVGRTSIPVLIQGESGTGKELCVRYLHALSGKDSQSLEKVNCPAIPHALLESELFGYEKGAFTNANVTKRGRLERAAGGTLFLDEVGSLDLGMQAKLLQVLQDGTFSRVGGHEVRTVETRLVSVANRNLRQQVADGSFRLDFLYRINAISLDLPPLRERAEDLPELVNHFLEEHMRAYRTRRERLSKSTLRLMERYSWPGNIRQLDNVIRSYVLLGSEEALMTELLEGEGGSSDPGLLKLDLSTPISLKQLTKQATHDLERRVILEVLRANNWNRRKTAKWLKMSYRSLLYKLNETVPAAEGHGPPPATGLEASAATSSAVRNGPRLV